MVLLKIEIYFAPPGGEQPAAQPAASSSSPSETHYASLSCRDSSIHKSNTDGRLWSLGRKHGDATIPTDKSVSREHVVLSVATANKTLLDHDNGADDSSTAGARPAACTTPAQLEACKQDFDQMCVLLQNLGKLGSTIVEEESESPDESAETKKQANEDDDSDTANSEEVSQSQNPSMSTAEALANAGLNAITKQLLLPDNNNSKIKIRPVGKDETVVLTKLCNNIYDEQDDSNGPSNSKINNKRVIVQCGKLGTTIVITRLHIQLALSSDAKKHKALKSLPPTWASGCAVVDHLSPFPQEPTTSETATIQQGSSFPPTAYFIATHHKATSRNLEAWCRGIKIVAPTFVTAAFVERSTPSAPWPAPPDHAPLEDGNSFWTDVVPNPKLWSAYTLFVHGNSGQGSEVDRVVQAAGARSVSLYRSDDTLIDNEDELRAIVNAHQNCIVTVSDARRARKKVVQILQNKLGVSVIVAKQVAKAITAQSLLQDADGNEIGGEALLQDAGGNEIGGDGGGDEEPEEEAPKAATVTATKETPRETNKLPPAAAAAAAAAAAEKGEQSDSSIGIKNSSKDGSSNKTASPKEAALEDSSRKVDSTKATATNEDDQDIGMEQEDPKILRKKSTAKPPPPKDKREEADSEDEGVEEKGMEDAEESMEVEQPEAADAEEPSRKKAENNVADVLEASSGPSLENQESRKGKRKELDPAAADGWLTALPQGKKRRQYIRSKEEIMETKGWQTVREAAPTDHVKGLLVVAQPTAVAAASPTTSNGPNFKAFRKNTVPPPRDPTAVRFTSVLTKENPQQQEIEEQQEELAKQQRMADELFRDAGRKGGRRR